jgi:hypothetical protein
MVMYKLNPLSMLAGGIAIDINGHVLDMRLAGFH